MKIAVFNTKNYDREFFDEANKQFGHELVYFEVHLKRDTCKLAHGFQAVCVFVNDEIDGHMIEELAKHGTQLIALRSAGFNNVDLKSAHKSNLTIARVPAYSPHGVAEHAVALILSLNRKIYRAHNRVRDGNFSLDGLLGFELYGQTVGLIGTGKIGLNMARIMLGFGCKVIAYDPYPNDDCKKMGVRYDTLDVLYQESDIISLHLPMMKETHHLINKTAVSKMKKGVTLINTSRGGLIDTKAVIEGLKSEKIGYLGLDVYEEETDFFFEDFSNKFIQDDVFARLLTFPNVAITGHQAFFTKNALKNIAEVTLKNIKDFERGAVDPGNLVTEKHLQLK